MEFEQMLRLVEMVSTSGLTEFDYEEGNLKIHLGKKLPKMPQIGKNSGTLNSRECRRWKQRLQKRRRMERR